MDLKGSKTEENLMKALQGEALAHLKYQFYKRKLVDVNKGYEHILDEIIHNEKEHGKIWFKTLHDGAVPDNITNLIDAIEGETYEATVMYREFGDIAIEEGFEDIGKLFHSVADIEAEHSHTFEIMKYEVSKSDELLYKSLNDEDAIWKCLNCGHVVKGKSAPSECPVCKHPMKYFVKEW